MSRNNPKGSIQTVVAAAYKAGLGIEQASADIGLSISTLSQHTEIPTEGSKRAGGLGINYVDRHCRASAAAAAVYAEHFAALAGGTFQVIDSPTKPQAMWQHLACMAKETGEAVAALSSIDHGADRAEVRRELIEARDALDAAIRDLDAQPTPISRRAV